MENKSHDKRNRNSKESLEKVNLLDESIEPTEEQFNDLFEAMLVEVNRKSAEEKAIREKKMEEELGKKLEELQAIKK